MTAPNPFEPPSELADRAFAEPGHDPRAIRVYSANQIGLATFLGSIVAGTLLMASNYRALGRPTAAWQTIAFGIAATIAFLGLSTALPGGRSYGLPLVLTLATRALANVLQGQDIARVLAKGGTKHSTWRATGIGLACLVCIVSIAIVASYFFIDV